MTKKISSKKAQSDPTEEKMSYSIAKMEMCEDTKTLKEVDRFEISGELVYYEIRPQRMYLLNGRNGQLFWICKKTNG